jgi:DNA repair exonuclease SbcCD ATPase subunit
MAEATPVKDRVFSEDEAYAIAADRVKSETASLTEKITTLESEKAELANKLDIEIAAREAAEQKATAAEAKHEEFLAQAEAEKAALARKDERLTKVKEAASHLTDEFFKDESRVERIISMDEDAFDGYVADLRDAASAAPAESGTPPRETSMEGDKVTPKGSESAESARSFLMRSYVAPKEG